MLCVIIPAGSSQVVWSCTDFLRVLLFFYKQVYMQIKQYNAIKVEYLKKDIFYFYKN